MQYTRSIQITWDRPLAMNTPKHLDPDAAHFRPWYKEGWMWLVVGIPLAAIILGLTMVYLAVTNPHAMVTDNYYKEGLAINRELGFERNAREMELEAEMHINGQIVSVRFKDQMHLPHKLLDLRLIHPTLERFDQSTVLTSKDQITFVGKLVMPLESARYYIHMESQEFEWRMKTRLKVKNQQASGTIDARQFD